MEVYVLAKEDEFGTHYLTEEYKFSDDIRCALKAKNVITASLLRAEFEDEITNRINIENFRYKSNLEIMFYEL